jgi:hypothetical protein
MIPTFIFIILFYKTNKCFYLFVQDLFCCILCNKDGSKKEEIKILGLLNRDFLITISLLYFYAVAVVSAIIGAVGLICLVISF